MMPLVEPQLGMRFSMMGSSFEVSFVSEGTVRYSATAGGQAHRLSFIKFLDLQTQGILIPSENARVHTTSLNCSATLRKYRYVEAALRNLEHPTARGPLAQLIKSVASQISDLRPPSVRAVAYWVQAYKKSQEGSLNPRKRRGNKTLRFQVEVEHLLSDAIANRFLRREWQGGEAVRAEVVGRAAQLGLCDSHRNIVKLPTIRTIQRRIEKLDPELVDRAQSGTRVAGKRARASGKSANSNTALLIVQMDSHWMDVLVVDPDTGKIEGRPWLTVILDVHTRCIVGIYISMYNPSSTTALAALKDMLVRFGVPALIIPDNGIEFANSAFILLCNILKITIQPAQKYDPNGKAHLESFFRTFTQALIQSLLGTTFSNPEARGDYDSKAKARFTLSQIQSFADEWINEIYHKTVHTRTLRAPLFAWQDAVKTVAPLKLSAAEVDILARRPYERTIQKGRVQFADLFYYSHALATLEAKGTKKITLLVDELNLHTMFVEDPATPGTYLMAESTNADYTEGLTYFAHEEARKIKKQFSKDDLQRYGRNAHLIARWKLIERIQNESEVAKNWLRKLTNGAGRKQAARNTNSAIVDAPDSIESLVFPQKAPQTARDTAEACNDGWNSIADIKSLDTD